MFHCFLQGESGTGFALFYFAGVLIFPPIRRIEHPGSVQLQ